MDKKKQLVTIVSFSIFLLIAIPLLIWAFSSSNKGMPSTSITNYSNTVSNLPGDYKDKMQSFLFNIIKLNNSTVDPASIKDSLIREGSHSQKNPKSGQYSGSFIVDIPSLRQSYKITYKYSREDDGFDSGYPFISSCVDTSELIYEAFNCKNPQYWETPDDPLLQKLPYKGSNYTISYYDEKNIIVKISLTYSSGTDKFFKSYAEEARAWLVSQGFNLENYSIEYRDIKNNILKVAL